MTTLLMPRTLTPAMLAAVAFNYAPADPEDYALAAEAINLLPPTEHPDALDILAEIARDYRNAVLAWFKP